MNEPGRQVTRTTVVVASGLSVLGAAHAWWNSRRLRHLAPGSARDRTARSLPAGPDLVSVLLPARDEAANIVAALSGIRAQRGIGALEVLVGDDGSSDDTRTLAERVAAEDRRVTVLPVPPPPPGWLGKPYACQYLADRATGATLVFVDADVRLEPGALAAALDHCRDVSLCSAWPGQQAITPLARLVQPLQQWSWLTTLPLDRLESDLRPAFTAANGQFLICDRADYRHIGGHAAIRDQVLDDIALARAFKSASLRIRVADASAVATTLMYRTDRDLIAGYAKSLWAAFGGPVRGILVTGALGVVYAGPPAYLVFGRDRVTRGVAAAGYLAGVLNRVISARSTGAKVWPDAFFHPLSVLALTGLTGYSVLQRRRGGLRWRGRPV